MPKILIIEDDEKLREELKIFLNKNGYNAITLTTFDNTIQDILQTNPDLILLDINLPNTDGEYICKEIRKQSNMPIIIVTSRDNELDELLSINNGADHYITKPFNIPILLAKIGSLLRRTNMQEVNDKIDEKDFILNTEILEREDYKEYLKAEYGIEDISNFKEIRTMELGHIFQLGTRYSEMMNGKYISQEGKEELYYMGCYGIGVSRTLAALYEKCVVNDKSGKPCGFVLPERISPYMLQIVVKPGDEEKVKLAEAIEQKIFFTAYNVIIDDRDNISIGAKIKDVKILGTPYMIVLGDKSKEDEFEIESTKTGEKTTVKFNDLSKFFLEIKFDIK